MSKIRLGEDSRPNFGLVEDCRFRTVRCQTHFPPHAINPYPETVGTGLLVPEIEKARIREGFPRRAESETCFSGTSLFGRVFEFRLISVRHMPEGRNLRVFFQEAGIRKGVRRGDGILVGILQRAESGYGFSKGVQITNYPYNLFSGGRSRAAAAGAARDDCAGNVGSGSSASDFEAVGSRTSLSSTR